MPRMQTSHVRAIVGLAASILGVGCAGATDDDASGSESALGRAGVGAAGTCMMPALAIHVAPTGNDSASGAAEAPLRTITKALAAAQAGDTVLVHGGTYKELVTFPRSGAPQRPITLRGRCGERPVLDGGGLGGGKPLPALIYAEDRAHLVIDGFELTGLVGKGGNFPAAVWIRGASKDIVVRNNRIHGIIAENRGNDGGAHGIGVYGTRTDPAEDIVLEANELSSLVLGPSEALVVNGNVRRFKVLSNEVYGVDNIAFDFIGYEGTCAGCSGTDLTAAAVDRVRDGVVSDNLAHDVTSRGNPAYGQDRSAGCFYVDGGGNIVIERNVAHHCDLGVELASEHAGKATTAIVVRNNFLWGNWVAGISTGGYSTGSGPGGGSAEGCSVVHNTIVDSSRDSWASTGLLLQSRNRGNTYVNNIIVATSGSAALRVGGAGNANNAIHHNLYAGGGVVGAAAGAGSVLAPAGLRAAGTGDLHLTAGSSAIGAGATLPASLTGATDIDGEPRGTDVGADQHRVSSDERFSFDDGSQTGMTPRFLCGRSTFL